MENVLNALNCMWKSETFIINVIYILSISFQLAAGLLLVGNTITSKKGIIKTYCAQHTAIAFEENGILANCSGLKEVVRTTWMNRIAFSYLFIGYLVGIWGEVSVNKEISFWVIAFLTLFLVGVTCKYAKYRSEKFGSITINDIPMKDGVMFVTLDKKETISKEISSNNEKHEKNKKKMFVRWFANIIDFWRDFIKGNRAIVVTGIVAIGYCIVCVIFKSDTKLNVNAAIRPWGEFLFNMSISVIAAVIFYIVQVFIPERSNRKKCMEILRSKLVDLITFVDVSILACKKYIRIKDNGAEILWDCKEEGKVYFKILKQNAPKATTLKSYTKAEIFNLSKEFNKKIDNIKNSTLVNYCEYTLLESISQLEQCNFFAMLNNVIIFADTELGLKSFDESIDLIQILNNKIKKLCLIEDEFELGELNELEKRVADLPRRNVVQELNSIEEFNKNNIKAVVKSEIKNNFGEMNITEEVLDQVGNQILEDAKKGTKDNGKMQN